MCLSDFQRTHLKNLCSRLSICSVLCNWAWKNINVRHFLEINKHDDDVSLGNVNKNTDSDSELMTRSVQQMCRGLATTRMNRKFTGQRLYLSLNLAKFSK